MSHHQGPVE